MRKILNNLRAFQSVEDKHPGMKRQHKWHIAKDRTLSVTSQERTSDTLNQKNESFIESY
jgi:hypothetical protein